MSNKTKISVHFAAPGRYYLVSPDRQSDWDCGVCSSEEELRAQVLDFEAESAQIGEPVDGWYVAGEDYVADDGPDMRGAY